MLARRKVLLVKVESTYATDPTPAAASDAVLVRNCDIKPVEGEFVDRELVRPHLGHDEQIPVATRMSARFAVEMAGSGTAGTAPAWGKLLRGCGFAETVNAGVDVQYDPVSASFASLTMYYYLDGLLHKLLGCRGTVSLKMTPRQVPVFEFSFTGLYGGITDVALVSPTLTAWKAPIAVNNANTGSFALHSYGGKLYDMAIDLANTVTYRNLVGTEDVQITDRAPAGSIEVESTLIATKDYFTIAKNGTLGALTITHGTTGGYKVKVDAPAAQLMQPEYADRDGVLATRMGLRLVPSSGNDELKITAL